jgi:aromatic-L-amino-acid decarboxylase
MRVDALADALAADVRAGVTPVAVVATSGTTLTGAIDPLEQVADLCAEHGVWMHVDGAYGGPAAGVPSLAPLFSGIERADSLTIDAHKWLGVQKSCSMVLLARQGPLEQAFGHEERYMLHTGVAANSVTGTLEYSRPVRSLKLWLAFRIYGAAMLRSWIEMTVRHARDLAAALTENSRFQLLNEPALSAVCFRHLADGNLSSGQLDDHNLSLAHRIMQDGRIYLAPARVDGKACLRVCFMNFRTDSEEVCELVRVIEELAG